MILFAIFFFLLGSLVCGVAPNITVLIAGRGIAGIGAGGLIGLTMIIVSDVVSPRERGYEFNCSSDIDAIARACIFPLQLTTHSFFFLSRNRKYQGIIGAMFGLSAIIGPLLGGFLAEHSSWRWAFYLNLPLGAVSTVAMFFILKLPSVKGSYRQKLKRVDFLGSITFVVGIICVLLSTNWGGNEYSWSSVQIIVPYCVGAMFLAIFLFIEAKIAVEPILPFRLFRNRSVCATYATSFFIGGYIVDSGTTSSFSKIS